MCEVKGLLAVLSKCLDAWRNLFASSIGTVIANGGLALLLAARLHLIGLVWLGVFTLIIFWAQRHEKKVLLGTIEAYQQLIKAAGLKQMLSSTLKTFYDAMHFPPDADVHCGLWVPEESAEELVLVTYHRSDGRTPFMERLSTSKGIIGKAFRSGKDQLDVLEDQRFLNPTGFESWAVEKYGFTHLEARQLEHDRRAYLGLPLRGAGNSVMGVLYCSSKDCRAFIHLRERAKELVPFFSCILASRRG